MPYMHHMKLTAAFLACFCAASAWSQTPDPTSGQEVIKPKDFWDETGVFHPFVRMPKYILQDQKAIWTSPFHTRKQDAKFWAIFGSATVALIATDKWTAKNLPNSSSQV